MRPDELEAILTQTLDDYRLSRSERKALSARLEDVDLDETDQTLCHNVAFELAQIMISNLSEDNARALGDLQRRTFSRTT